MENENILEERAKKFLKSKTSLNYGGLYLVEIDNLNEHISEIDYLVEKRYIREIGDTIKTFHYASTVEGRRWAKS
jgi:hypothetical protein